MDDTKWYKCLSGKKSYYSTLVIPFVFSIIVGIYVFVLGGNYFLISLSLLLFLAVCVLVIRVGLGGKNVFERVIRAETIPENYRKLLESVIEDVCLASGLERPSAKYIEQPFVNAYGVRWGRERCIYFSNGLLEEFSKDELRAVVAHLMARMDEENGGFENIKLTMKSIPKFLMLSVGTVFGLVFMLMAVGFVLAVLIFMVPFLIAVGTKEFTGVILYYLLIFSPVIGYLRVRPDRGSIHVSFYKADERAIRWTMYPEALISALQKASKSSADKTWRWLNGAAFAVKGPGVKITSYIAINTTRRATRPAINRRKSIP